MPAKRRGRTRTNVRRDTKFGEDYFTHNGLMIDWETEPESDHDEEAVKREDENDENSDKRKGHALQSASDIARIAENSDEAERTCACSAVRNAEDDDRRLQRRLAELRSENAKYKHENAKYKRALDKAAKDRDELLSNICGMSRVTRSGARQRVLK